MVSLSELLREGENSGVEFTRDDVQPHDFAKELVALTNLRGGHILLGAPSSARSREPPMRTSTSGG